MQPSKHRNIEVRGVQETNRHESEDIIIIRGDEKKKGINKRQLNSTYNTSFDAFAYEILSLDNRLIYHPFLYPSKYM